MATDEEINTVNHIQSPDIQDRSSIDLPSVVSSSETISQ